VITHVERTLPQRNLRRTTVICIILEVLVLASVLLHHGNDWGRPLDRFLLAACLATAACITYIFSIPRDEW
jgi:hypothetical protein